VIPFGKEDLSQRKKGDDQNKETYADNSQPVPVFVSEEEISFTVQGIGNNFRDIRV
jgi:hypothetical protein